MREILFRGKTAGGEWVYGDLLNVGVDYDYAIRTYGGREHGQVNAVNGKTVGQYTGLTDKNGKKIFEGDIVEGHCHSQWSHRLQRCVVEYDRDTFVARHYVEQGGVMRYYSYKVLFSKDVVVIGNIHDNPELMKGGE